MSWKTVGSIFANIAKYSAKAALWASEHPQVIATIASVAGNQKVAAQITQYSPAIQAVGTEVGDLTSK